jgi:hypothetical protein
MKKPRKSPGVKKASAHRITTTSVEFGGGSADIVHSAIHDELLIIDLDELSRCAKEVCEMGEPSFCPGVPQPDNHARNNHIVFL